MICFDQRIVIKQANFIYSLLGKVLEKQTKAIGEKTKSK